jgi:hypothetical protein
MHKIIYKWQPSTWNCSLCPALLKPMSKGCEESQWPRKPQAWRWEIIIGWPGRRMRCIPAPPKNPGERDSPLLLPGVHTLELSNAPPSLLKGHTNEMNDQRHQRSHNIKNKLYFKTLWQMSFSAGVHYAPTRFQSYLWCLMGSFKNYTY